MTPETLELLRNELLLELYNTRLPSGLRGIYIAMQAAGFNAGQDDVERQLEYLVGKGLVEQSAHPISAGKKLWKLTAAGTEYLEANNLV